MTTQLALSFYGKDEITVKKKQNSEWGTFKDSLKAPVHRWFTHPAYVIYRQSIKVQKSKN